MKYFLLYAILFCFISCKKPINCSNAQLCVQNKVGKVVHYNFNGTAGQYLDSIMPNASACIYVGQVIEKNGTDESEWVYFFSDQGNYVIEVNTCNQIRVLQ
jgi:hypothetical protein